MCMLCFIVCCFTRFTRSRPTRVYFILPWSREPFLDLFDVPAINADHRRREKTLCENCSFIVTCRWFRSQCTLP